MWEIINQSKLPYHPTHVSAQVAKVGSSLGEKCIDILAADPDLLKELVQDANGALKSFANNSSV